MRTDPNIGCPACDGVEWFPGAACFHCGWEGSLSEAFAKLRQRVSTISGDDALALVRNSTLDDVAEMIRCYERAHPDQSASHALRKRVLAMKSPGNILRGE